MATPDLAAWRRRDRYARRHILGHWDSRQSSSFMFSTVPRESMQGPVDAVVPAPPNDAGPDRVRELPSSYLGNNWQAGKKQVATIGARIRYVGEMHLYGCCLRNLNNPHSRNVVCEGISSSPSPARVGWSLDLNDGTRPQHPLNPSPGAMSPSHRNRNNVPVVPNAPHQRIIRHCACRCLIFPPNGINDNMPMAMTATKMPERAPKQLMYPTFVTQGTIA